MKRPNVLFIITDNQGAWTLGCYGNEETRTPSIDALAAGGIGGHSAKTAPSCRRRKRPRR